MRRRVPLLAAALLFGWLSSAHAQVGSELTLPEVEIVGTAPLASGTERDRVPANTQVLGRDDLTRTGPSDALRALSERAGGVSLDEAQGNPFQPNLIYRGFEASPLVGNPQGLAVYLNGTRFNAPFGDTTNWDLIPDVAIDRIELAGSNPAFGLNALGGAIAVRLRDGFNYQGAEAELSGGYHVTPQWTVGATGVLASGRVLQGDQSNLNPRTGGYVVLNLNIKYRVTEKIELFGLVQNLLDQRYATFGAFSPVSLVSLVPILQAPGASNPRSLSPGPPLAGYGGVRVTF
jgi:outer membrane cobalamin receptor